MQYVVYAYIRFQHDANEAVRGALRTHDQLLPQELGDIAILSAHTRILYVYTHLRI